MYHKFNESKSHNRSLRTDIDNLRRERLVFDDIHRKLAKSLLVKRKEMAAVIAHTNHILESRDKVSSSTCPAAFFPVFDNRSMAVQRLHLLAASLEQHRDQFFAV